jgi:hypothetical protein
MKIVRQQANRSCADGALSFKVMMAMTLSFGVVAISLQAAQPAWWTSRGAINSSPRNDSAVVNEGQLKKFTFESVQELNADLTGGAGSTLNSMALGWSNYYHTNGFSTNDYQAMNVGQLKQIASLVYPPLISAGYMTNTPTWLHTNSLVDSNLATLGQLKQVFAFEIATPQVPVNLVVLLGTTTATLNWADPVISVQYFTVQMSTDGGTTWTSLPNVAGTSFSDTITGLTPGVDYSFRVTASNPSGSSAPSSSDAAPIISLLTPYGATLVP